MRIKTRMKQKNWSVILWRPLSNGPEQKNSTRNGKLDVSEETYGLWIIPEISLGRGEGRHLSGWVRKTLSECILRVSCGLCEHSLHTLASSFNVNHMKIQNKNRVLTFSFCLEFGVIIWCSNYFNFHKWRCYSTAWFNKMPCCNNLKITFRVPEIVNMHI